LHKRRLGGLFLPRPTGVAATIEPHELDDGFVFWPESLGPKPSDGPALVRVGTASRAVRRPSRPKGRRALGAVAFTTLFFGGAAFTASAGDKVAGLLGATSVGNPAAAVGGVEVEGAAPAKALAGLKPAVSAPRSALAQVSVAQAQTERVAAELQHAAPTAQVHTAVAHASTPFHVTAAAPRKAIAHLARHRKHHAVRAEHVTPKPAPVHVALAFGDPGAAPVTTGARGQTFWSAVALPDPIPAALRLAPSFAQQLQLASARAGVDWSLVLGVARADGGSSATPVAPAKLGALARRLADLGGAHDQWAAANAYGKSSAFADRAVALAHYDRAVGVDALVKGLAAEKEALEARVLNDLRLTIYAGGRDDIAQGHVDVRVLAVIEYLADTYGRVNVTCLITGHGEFARPGVISAHVYGRAIDIGALDGISMNGHQQPGSITERAVRSLLLLPPEVEPAQIISLLGLGGASFALANHYDHIHVGF
jgi:hypothetical protein